MAIEDKVAVFRVLPWGAMVGIVADPRTMRFAAIARLSLMELFDLLAMVQETIRQEQERIAAEGEDDPR